MNPEKNLNEVMGKIDGRAELIAVTKTVDVETIKKLISFGANTFGENRIRDSEPKIKEINKSFDVKWHMIGHLQSNKAKKAVELFDVIQSVDSLKLAKIIDKEAGKIGKIMDVMIEVNISEMENRSGVVSSQVNDFFKDIFSLNLQNIKVIGLMAMAPFVSAEETRPYFREMKRIFDLLKDKYNITKLSMGMTNDYLVAIEEGSNMVRVGTALYR